jgi:hypothetical protein
MGREHGGPPASGRKPFHRVPAMFRPAATSGPAVVILMSALAATVLRAAAARLRSGRKNARGAGRTKEWRTAWAEGGLGVTVS